MEPRRRKSVNTRLLKLSEKLDDYAAVISPRWAYRRRAFRFGYEVLDRSRQRKKRSGISGTGDSQLTAERLARLRDICEDLARNNPLVKGILRRLATKVVGTSTKIQARTADAGWNAEAERLFKAEMVERPCDVTGRFGIQKYLKTLYQSYATAGDIFTIFTDDGLQAVEGCQVGTPYGRKDAKNYDRINGIAVSKKTKKVIGYYVGVPNRWGYIKNEDVKMYPAGAVHHSFSPDRFSCSRGEPALVSAVDTIDKLFGYIDAELVAAKINACFPMMITTRDAEGKNPAYTGGISSTGKDADDRTLVKIDPGMIWEGDPGEEAKAIGAARPAQAFDNFVLRILMLIGNPVNLPLMLVTGDYSGATFMNSRVAYQEARDTWADEQELVIKPFLHRVWLWKVSQWIARKKLTERDDWALHEIQCKRWPYVDPYKESMADKQQLANGTTTRTDICARQGDDFRDVTDRRADEEKYLGEKGVTLTAAKQKSNIENKNGKEDGR